MTEPITDPDLEARLVEAQRWSEHDPEPSDRAQVEDWIRTRDREQLERHFGAMLEFGTAGLRGAVGPGPGAMNRAMIRITTRAVADYLLKHEPEAHSKPVVLGYDARLSSRAFAEEAAGVLVAAGLSVRYYSEPVPTPLVAYALLQLGGSAGIVITASHNPKWDNGYKLYASNGIQIVSPVDQAVADRMRAFSDASAIACLPGALDGAHANALPVGAEIVESYHRDIDALRPRRDRSARLGIVYTPLHGVGGRFVARALATAGFDDVHVVPEQAEPDGNFPTASFPNPELDGPMDLALALGKRSGAALLLANDPDADRLAVSVRRPDGEYQKLTGNEVGVLLADYLLGVDAEPSRALVVRSVVSTPLFDRVAAHYGARCETTLTGFKWVWTAALELSRALDLHLAFAFEEALGYCVGSVVRDKDGVSAALVLAELARELAAENQTLLDRLEAIYRRQGLWISVQRTIRREPPEGAAILAHAIHRLASAPPSHLGGLLVESAVDYRSGAAGRPRWLGEAPLLEFGLGERGRVLVRPSGTEPLLKCYVDLTRPVSDEEELSAAKFALQAEARTLADELMRAAGLE